MEYRAPLCVESAGLDAIVTDKLVMLKYAASGY